MKGFKNVKAYIYKKGIITTNIGVEDGIIKYIGNDDSVITEEYPYQNDTIIVPGFIDEHIHGSAGYDAMDATIEAIKNIAESISQDGVTAFLPTTMTQSKENITKALENINLYMQNYNQTGAEVLGVHLEGPFISKRHVGAQPIEYVEKPNVEAFDKYYKASGNHIKIVSMAPEEDENFALTKYLKALNVVASIGHTDSTSFIIEEGIKYGLSNVTHTYNAQKALHHREIGTVGSALLFDDLRCEAICDEIHLSIPAIKLLIKNKPDDKFILITDSMRAKHLADGESELGGQKVYVKNGEARLTDGTLAGSILKMNDAIKNLVNDCGVEFTKAIDFATINPAKSLNVDNIMGSIEVGKKANFAIINKNFDVLETIRNGLIIYKNF